MTAVIPNKLRWRDDVVTDGGVARQGAGERARRAERLLRRAQGDRIVADLTDLTLAAMRDGLRAREFCAASWPRRTSPQSRRRGR